jgi:acetoin utilization protein AcuC
VWATLNGIDAAVPPTAAAEAVLRGVSWHRSQGRTPSPHWFTTIADPPQSAGIRDEVRELAAEALAPSGSTATGRSASLSRQ